MNSSIIGSLVRLKVTRQGTDDGDARRFNVIAIVASGVVVQDAATGTVSIFADDQIVVVRHAHNR